MSETKRRLLPPHESNPNSNKRKRKPESKAQSLFSQLKTDPAIISSLECLRSLSQSSSLECLRSPSQSFSSRSETLNLAELDPILQPRELGSVVGRLTFTQNGRKIDLSKGGGLSGFPIPRPPPNVHCARNFNSDALFILLVECHDTFTQLVAKEFYNRFPSIIITSNGYPDGETGIFLRQLTMEFGLPVLALLDCDPHGFEMLSLYVLGGSKDMPILDIKWMGMRPSDLDKYGISEDYRLPMTDQEVKAAKDLLEGFFVKRNNGWLKELQMMVKTRQKAEIMALCSFGLQYRTEAYLPLKLQQQDWL